MKQLGTLHLDFGFHVVPYGETTRPPGRDVAEDFEEGLLVGLLVGEGTFGGDGRQPHVVLRMHVRHEAIFRWMERTFPGGRLYGPYEHGGRRYMQWMARGAYLREDLLPILERHLSPSLDRHSFDRFQTMCSTYARQLRRPAEPAPEGGLPARESPVGGSRGGAPLPDIEAIFARLRQEEADFR